MPKITNILELRNDLLDCYDILKADPRRMNQVGELVNAAGKIMNSVKLELEYAFIRKEHPEIEFLSYPGRKALPLSSEVKKIKMSVSEPERYKPK